LQLLVSKGKGNGNGPGSRPAMVMATTACGMLLITTSKNTHAIPTPTFDWNATASCYPHQSNIRNRKKIRELSNA
jgi:hypothetical protein